MKEKIEIKPIEIIHTPYKEPKVMPIQGKFEKDITAQIELFPEHQEGLIRQNTGTDKIEIINKKGG